MYLTRGQPIIYYGDEQGFIGAGGVAGGPNLSLTVPASSRVTFSYLKATHLITAIVSPA